MGIALYKVGQCTFPLSKPTMKAPGTKRLKLKRDEPLSKSALKFNLRRYNKLNAMGLLPTHASDWVSNMVWPDCLLIAHLYTTISPHPPPWPDAAVPHCLLIAYPLTALSSHPSPWPDAAAPDYLLIAYPYTTLSPHPHP